MVIGGVALPDEKIEPWIHKLWEPPNYLKTFAIDDFLIGVDNIWERSIPNPLT